MEHSLPVDVGLLAHEAQVGLRRYIVVLESVRVDQCLGRAILDLHQVVVPLGELTTVAEVVDRDAHDLVNALLGRHAECPWLARRGADGDGELRIGVAGRRRLHGASNYDVG